MVKDRKDPGISPRVSHGARIKATVVTKVEKPLPKERAMVESPTKSVGSVVVLGILPRSAESDL